MIKDIKFVKLLHRICISDSKEEIAKHLRIIREDRGLISLIRLDAIYAKLYNNAVLKRLEQF